MEMALWVRSMLTKPDKLSLIPDICKKSVVMEAVAYTHTPSPSMVIWTSETGGLSGRPQNN